VAGIFLYLYSPLLDHWLGNGTHSRPHSHTQVASRIVLEGAHSLEHTSVATTGEHGEHEEEVLCLLDIDALLALVLTVTGASPVSLEPQQPLVFGAFASYLDVSVIYLSSLDPPPNI
jgi:hypothetical protein